MTLYCATSNAGKLREFRLAGGDVIDIQPLPAVASLPAPHETGTTFEENAELKARYYAAQESGYVFAEDSGLEVTALGGAPGVYSARFAGETASDEANNALLLERLRGVEDRSARYVCAIALVRAGELLKTVRGEVEGIILPSATGSGGFGYDPLFYYPPFGCTFAEVDAVTKQTVSHRGRAVGELLRWLREFVA